MKRFSFSLIVGSAALVLAAGTASAQPPAGMTPPAAGERMRKQPPFEQLGLTDQQKEQIRHNFLETRKKNIDVEAKKKVAGIELHELMSADAPDQNKINAKITELSKLNETLLRNRTESALTFQKILTPEQRKKMKAFGPLMREHFRGSHHHFDDDGPGMMRRGGFGHGRGMGLPPELSEFEEEF